MKKLIEHLLYVPKHAKASDENISKLIMPSMIGILLCAVCLAGLTWAWFSASINTKPQTMTAANFDVQIEVVDSNGLSASLGMLKGGEIYTLTLIEQGTSVNSGYCMIEIGGRIYYTENIPKNGSFEFTLIPAADGPCTVTPVWNGSPPDGAIKKSDTIDLLVQQTETQEAGAGAAGDLDSAGSETNENIADRTQPVDIPEETIQSEIPAENIQENTKENAGITSGESTDAGPEEETGEMPVEEPETSQPEDTTQKTINETGQEIH